MQEPSSFASTPMPVTPETIPVYFPYSLYWTLQCPWHPRSALCINKTVFNSHTLPTNSSCSTFCASKCVFSKRREELKSWQLCNQETITIGSKKIQATIINHAAIHVQNLIILCARPSRRSSTFLSDGEKVFPWYQRALSVHLNSVRAAAWANAIFTTYIPPSERILDAHIFLLLLFF